MKLTKSIVLMQKYSSCPECGNGYLANGQGEMNIEDNYFERKCKCGWRIKTDEDGNVLEHES